MSSRPGIKSIEDYKGQPMVRTPKPEPEALPGYSGPGFLFGLLIVALMLVVNLGRQHREQKRIEQRDAAVVERERRWRQEQERQHSAQGQRGLVKWAHEGRDGIDICREMDPVLAWFVNEACGCGSVATKEQLLAVTSLCIEKLVDLASFPSRPHSQDPDYPLPMKRSGKLGPEDVPRLGRVDSPQAWHYGQCYCCESLRGIGLLANLRELDIRRMPISDLSPLAGMKNLRKLNLLATPAEDLSPLEGMDVEVIGGPNVSR